MRGIGLRPMLLTRGTFENCMMRTVFARTSPTPTAAP